MYKLFMAWRFLWARLVSYVGTGLLALAVMLFVIVMAVMEGMGDMLRENIRKTNAHVQVIAPAGPGMLDWREIMAKISQMDGVTGVTPAIEGFGRASVRHFSFDKCVVRGIDLDLERRYGGLGKYLSPPHVAEEFDFKAADGSGLPAALVGPRVATKMELVKGELLTLSVIQLADADRTGRMGFVVGADFKTDSMWLDHHLLVSLKDAQRIFGTGDRATVLGVWLDDHLRAHELKRTIQLSFLPLDPEEEAFFRKLTPEPLSVGELALRAGMSESRAEEFVSRLMLKGAARPVGRGDEPRYVEHSEPQVRTWADQHPDLFRGVAHEATIMRIILVIVIGFVGVLVLCLLWLMVEQKVRDIGIMVALGAGRWGVVSIFVIDGTLMGLVGTALGLGLGTLVAWKVDAIAGFFHLNVFPPETFYGATELPSTIRGFDLVLVASVAMAFSVLASVLPALRAARADPVESLRHG